MPKSYSAELKKEVVLKTIQSDRPNKEIAEAYGVHEVTVSKWRTEFFENAEKAFSASKEVQEKEERIQELEQELDDEKLRRKMLQGFLAES